MHKVRLGALADGIFAIVMTLLALDIRVPVSTVRMTDAALIGALRGLLPIFASYVLSFLVLAAYWISHHFIVSIFAKNLTRKVVSLNMPFLLLVGLVPFSAHMLGLYYYLQTAIFLYAANMMLIGLLLLLIMIHEFHSDEVHNIDLTRADKRKAFIRVLIPIISAAAGAAASFWSPVYAIYIFVAAVLINLVPGVVSGIDEVAVEFAKNLRD